MNYQKHHKQIEKYLPELIKFRHDIHANPELGFEETRTKAKLLEKLNNLDIKITEFGDTGFVASLQKGNSDKAIMLRSELDALPIYEKSKHDYASKTDGKMHACGHDGHLTTLLGAAQYIHDEVEFNGVVHFLFQPNEENGLGAQNMIEAGLFDKLKIDEAYGLHNLPGLELGKFVSREGMFFASETLFEITVKGQGGHAAAPEKGCDALFVGAELISALHSIKSRKLAANNCVVISPTEFTTDGARNILPSNGTIKGDFRAGTPIEREEVIRLMQQICNGIAVTHQVEIEIEFDTQFIETINDQEALMDAQSAVESLGLEHDFNHTPFAFAEDFAHFLTHKKGCLIMMGNGTEGVHAKPLHADDYDFNDAAIPYGMAFWANLVKQLLK